jgi:hypothetical protein
MQNYGYFDILYFKDRSDRDRIAIREKNGSRSWSLIAIGFFSDRDHVVGSRSGKILERDRDPIANSNTKFFCKISVFHKASKNCYHN